MIRSEQPELLTIESVSIGLEEYGLNITEVKTINNCQKAYLERMATTDWKCEAENKQNLKWLKKPL